MPPQCTGYRCNRSWSKVFVNSNAARVIAQFTHGTAKQRMRWFDRGLQSGSLEGGDTFDIPYENL
ncbi:MAG TPA: neutral zinc metallopeptidase [Gammaproteobacteria bacterium]|nr:neutral zinc metallopeptidase [Gammaproteobacteria bacterium]